MLAYWDILIGLAVVEVALAFILLIHVYKIASRPVGARLTLLALVFIVQNIAGSIIYIQWKSMGYGPEISKPLLVIQLSIIAGTLILVDITRK